MSFVYLYDPIVDRELDVHVDVDAVLEKPDPRPAISAYHDMPYAIFCYPPEAEFALRAELNLLRTRLEQKGKRVTTISLAECLKQALDDELPVEQLVEAEKSVGLTSTIETVHEVLSSYKPLDRLVADAIPEELFDKIATEEDAVDPEELEEWLRKKEHPIVHKYWSQTGGEPEPLMIPQPSTPWPEDEFQNALQRVRNARRMK